MLYLSIWEINIPYSCYYIFDIYFTDSGVNMGVSTSGCGEHLIRTMFARLCARAAISTDPLGSSLVQAIKTHFLGIIILNDLISKI